MRNALAQPSFVQAPPTAMRRSIWHFERTGFALIWVVSCLALALVNHWLSTMLGIVSTELTWIETQRRLMLVVQPPDFAALARADHPLVLCLALLSGSALAAAIVGATAATFIAWQLRAIKAPLVWLPLIALQPSLLVPAAQYPAIMARALFAGLALVFLKRYLLDRLTYQLLMVGLALGGLMLVDQQAWPLLIIPALTLLISRRCSWSERLTMLLVALFPALFLSLSWRYLEWTQGTPWLDGRIMRLAFLPAADATSTVMLMSMLAFTFAPGVMLAATYARLIRSASPRSAIGTPQLRLAQLLLISLPLADMIGQLWNGHAQIILMCALPWLVLPLLVGPLIKQWRVTALVGTLLVISLLTGWWTVAPVADSANSSATVAAVPASAAASLQSVANRINSQLVPGQRVLLVGADLIPLVALVNQPDALILPHQLNYTLAVQNPAHWANVVVVSNDQPRVGGNDAGRSSVERRLDGYRLILQVDTIYVYQKESLPWISQ